MIINFNNLGNAGGGGGGSYTLPVASQSTLGGIKVGSGLTIDSGGTLNAEGGTNDVVLDVAELDNMEFPDRKVLWDEVYEKILAGHKIYAKGEVNNEPGHYAYLPLEKYKPETDASIHQGGFLYFAAIDYNQNIYLHFNISSTGNLTGLDNHSRLSKSAIYSLPTASSNTLGGVKIGSGITIDGNGVISVQGGGAEVVLLNKLTEQERRDLYSAITACYDYQTSSFTSAWTEDKYAFFIDLRDYADQSEYQTNDSFEGFFPMRVVRCHPTDFGGAVFFSGVEGDRYGEGRIINIRFVIVSDGSVDRNTWVNRPAENPTDLTIEIDSGGTINADASQGLGALSQLNSFGRIRFSYHGDNAIVGDGVLLSFHRKFEQIEGQDKLIEYISGLCNVEGVIYKGTWHFIEYGWNNSIAPDTWAAIS